MKWRTYFFISFFILIIYLAVSTKGYAAVTSVTYNNPIKVELADYNVNITTNGFYTIKNLSNNESLLLKNSLPISLSKDSSIFRAVFGAYSMSSPSGFEINEVTGADSFVTFTAKKGAKRNATTSDPDVVIYNNGEAAEYVSTYSAGNQEWYIIKAKNGAQLAVLKDSTVNLVSKITPSMVTINKINGNYNVFRGSLQYTLSSGSKPYLVNILDMQDYLKGVVPNEMPASWHINALRAQAVAARSYAYVKNQKTVLTKTTSSQVYNGYNSENSRTNQAVDDTNELYVKYNNKVIETFFFSTSGGKTASVGDVWNSTQSFFPYLVSRDDPYEVSTHSSWSYSFSSGTILNSFRTTYPDLGNSSILYDISSSSSKVGGSGSTTNGEVSAITIQTSLGEKKLFGNELFIRKIFPVSGTYGILPSNWFTIQANKSYKIQLASSVQEQFAVKNNTVQLANGTTTISTENVQVRNSNEVVTLPSDPPSINISGRGWGHRIGMSQYGANGYANHGWDYKQILTHYFNGSTVGTR